MRASLGARVLVTGPGGVARLHRGLYAGRHSLPWALLPGRHAIRVEAVGETYEGDADVRPGEEVEIFVGLR
jgi:hypothetical protein